MTIDLTKPIRRKGSRSTVGFRCGDFGTCVAYFDMPEVGYAGGAFVKVITKEELERDYENVPEPLPDWPE